MNSNIFQGCVPALMTPCLADRTPNYPALAKKAQALMAAGMNGVVYCGSLLPLSVPQAATRSRVGLVL